MELQRRQIYEMYDGMQTLNLSGRKFTYVIGRNKAFLEQEIINMEKFKERSKEYLEFEDELEKTRIKHAEKENGKPITQMKPLNGEMKRAYVIKDVEKPDSPFRLDVAKVEKKHEKAVEDHKAKLKEFEEVFLEEKSDIRLIKIHWDEVPESIGQY